MEMTKNRLAWTKIRHIHWLTFYVVHDILMCIHNLLFIEDWSEEQEYTDWIFCPLSLSSWHFLVLGWHMTWGEKNPNRPFLRRSSACLRNPIPVMNMNYISSALVTDTRPVIAEAWTFWRFGKYFLTRTQEDSNYLIKTFLQLIAIITY